MKELRDERDATSRNEGKEEADEGKTRGGRREERGGKDKNEIKMLREKKKKS